MKGALITFEGTEGSGKSTQIQRLAKRLREAGKEVVQIREPGGTEVGEEIRRLLKDTGAGVMSAKTELLLFSASRAELCREVIRPALERGAAVLCDRFFDSTIAYQAHGRGLPIQTVREIIQFSTGGLAPDLTLLLWIGLDVSERRRSDRDAEEGSEPDRMEEAGRDFFQRVEEGYRDIAEADPDRVRVLNGLRSVDEIEAEIWALVRELILDPAEQ